MRSKTDTAHAELPEVTSGTATDFTPVMGPHLKLRRPLRFFYHACFSH
ncbi:conserved hypothetical protein [Candidatus Sulfobium mesophilum]|uniref:Uncharacterized protein n=1 Tax=Candidatus Sulfobium mesophilum TaxID=2016548 RepID=A0A2U3QDY1_9BACT|nr:conserved hypothetical protein [Candidatus Sulfobium mesophilum]